MEHTPGNVGSVSVELCLLKWFRILTRGDVRCWCLLMEYVKSYLMIFVLIGYTHANLFLSSTSLDFGPVITTKSSPCDIPDSMLTSWWNKFFELCSKFVVLPLQMAIAPVACSVTRAVHALRQQSNLSYFSSHRPKKRTSTGRHNNMPFSERVPVVCCSREYLLQCLLWRCSRTHVWPVCGLA